MATMADMMQQHMGAMGYGYSWTYWLFQIIIVILFFIIVWWIVKGNRNCLDSKDSAHDILDKRLAKGEISIKEYQRLKKEIE